MIKLFKILRALFFAYIGAIIILLIIGKFFVIAILLAIPIFVILLSVVSIFIFYFFKRWQMKRDLKLIEKLGKEIQNELNEIEKELDYVQRTGGQN